MFTESDLSALLEKGGIDLDEFRKKSKKPVSMLLREIEHGEAVPEYDALSGRVIFSRRSVRIRVVSGQRALIELQRLYMNELGNTQMVRSKIGSFTTSGSQKEGETHVETSVRELREELGLDVDPLQLESVDPHVQTLKYLSTVWHGTWTYNLIRYKKLRVDRIWTPRPNDHFIIRDDEGHTMIYLIWRLNL